MRQYDNPNPLANGKGRLWGDYAGGYNPTDQEGEHTAIDGYDALGRPLTKRQQFKKNGAWSGPYSVSQTYDLAGNVKTMTYPSGRTVNYSYDQAGRLSSSSGNLGGSPSTYADTISYNAAGQKIKERFGTNTSLYHNLHYNNRQQLVSIRVGDSATDEWNRSRGAIFFLYGSTAITSWNIFANDTDNNGNLRRQITSVPLAGGGDVVPQLDDYTYDALNRLILFTDSQVDSGGQWTQAASQSFIYDPYGNRKITSASGGGVSNYNPSYDLSTNRINGLGYDAAGNIISDPLTGGTMTYDAEGRLRTATSGGGGNYVYDADGKRMRRITPEGEIWQVYGLGSQLLAEYAAGAAPSAPQKEYGYRNGQLLVIAEPGSGGNLAWGKATSQSSTDYGGPASRAVDGNTNGEWGANTYTHTAYEHQPWWQVDLGSLQQIEAVKIWNVTSCCSERLSNFYVLVSDNPFSSTDLTTTINQSGVSSYYTAGPAGLVTGIGVGRSGRYVRVQLAGDNWLHMAEVEVLAGTASGEGVKWLVQDHLGSTRMVVDRSGSLAGITRHDFAPFGEELSAGIRSEALGYGADSVRQKFTGKERDNETGLDYFGARYFASVQGRFTSVDPLWINAKRLVDPQRLNLFSYVRNNPLKFIDPDGADLELTAKNDLDAKKKFRIYQMGLEKQDRSHAKLIIGNGKNGLQKGQYRIDIDKNHNSTSENFQWAQKAANDNTALGKITVVRQGETYQLRHQEFKGGQDVLKTTPTTVTMGQRNKEFAGYTFFEYRGKIEDGISYAKDVSEMIIHGNQTNTELSVTMHHETRHLILGDFGRTALNSKHSQRGQPQTIADIETDKADREAKTNAKTP